MRNLAQLCVAIIAALTLSVLFSTNHVTSAATATTCVPRPFELVGFHLLKAE